MSTTHYTGDCLDGHRIVDHLCVDDLAAGEHTLWFRVATNAIGHAQHLPVVVYKGAKPGKKVMITAGVHGDEYNGILAAQRMVRELVGKEIVGTITIVPAINLTGMLHHSRDFFSADPDSSPCNLNRFFPGDANGNEANRYLHVLWHGLLAPNAELAIDLHTQTSGTSYPLYVFADFRIDDCLNMARLIEPDAILNDPGDAGVLETVWNQAGIPSITIEVGMGRYTQVDLIERTTRGMFNILTHYQLIQGELASISSCLEGQTITSLKAKQGGFVIAQVALMTPVQEGDLLAIGYDAFGREIERYTAPHAGTVLSINIEAIRAPGSLVARLISE
ncbi:succinylglutamate desuccinylase/aspartoacylase family protein [Vibrio sp. SM6]|uniref:Succinylglutamate desuccinylase/aspartoacylase family protein n=1 Tax=Vibrio agarilyticus TaxID=2726741 RepID=A0A7X8YG98_9VIBR|nr:succinylglutamate desuccinylase/aspartoacylase family protein [Vibrio agarilyticus]NLS12157.1 succinylglutamate desuccinylase/aspartoacylase family protein [Vibrio agarilyticus]